MSETVIPTMRFRYVMKLAPAEHGPDVQREAPVLQQRFERPASRAFWRDIPVLPLGTPDEE